MPTKLKLFPGLHEDLSIKKTLNFNPYSAGIDFSRQNLMSVDVRF